MNKRAETGVVGAVALFLFFLVMWFIWLGQWIAEVGADVVTQHSLVGIEAFLLHNLNFFVFVCMCLGMLGVMYFSSGQ